MEQSDRYEFLYFSQRKDNGLIEFNDPNDVEVRMILPRHSETNDLDKYYLQSMLTGFDGSGDFQAYEILDAFPVLSLTTDENDKFYKLSIARLQEFSLGKIEEDEYIGASIKHLFMQNQIDRKNDNNSLLDECLNKISPIMYNRDSRDTVNSEDYELSLIASYVPTSQFRRMKILKGWIEGALHYYDYSIMFFDVRFVGFDDFNENIIDVKSEDLSFHKNIYFVTKGPFLLHNSGLYYEMWCRIGSLKRDWLFTSPNNDNERDGKVMLFRNKELRLIFEECLTTVFRKGTYRINDVLKWNRYSDGGKFNDHFDTMFVNKSSNECSLYTLLIYLEVENEDNFLFLGNEEVVVQLESNKAYIIPHWVKHRVNGTGLREFIKAEIVFKNKPSGVTFDQSIADAFDQSCYYMLQSVRHPELKDVVSRSFNAINEARFFKTQFLPTLDNHIFLLKTIKSVPLKYYSMCAHKLERCDFNISYVTDGKYYYFKIKTGRNVTANEAVLMLTIMHLDIHPKRMSTRCVEACECGHDGCISYYQRDSDLSVSESIFYWSQKDSETQIDQNLLPFQLPNNLVEIVSVANISVPDIDEEQKSYYFAACQNTYPCYEYYQSRITEITAPNRDGNYNCLNITFIGLDRNIVKIRQSSFCNGVKVTNDWHLNDGSEYLAPQRESPDEGPWVTVTAEISATDILHEYECWRKPSSDDDFIMPALFDYSSDEDFILPGLFD